MEDAATVPEVPVVTESPVEESPAVEEGPASSEVAADAPAEAPAEAPEAPAEAPEEEAPEESPAAPALMSPAHGSAASASDETPSRAAAVLSPAAPAAGSPSVEAGASSGRPSLYAEARQRLVKRDLQRYSGATDSSVHSWDPREAERYSERINRIMAGEPDWAPLTPGSGDIFRMVSDGKLLCRFLNKCQPKAVGDAVLKAGAKGTAKSGKFANTETLNSFVEAARVSGLEVGNIGSSDLLKAEAEHKEHLILGIVWQLLRRHLANEIKAILAKQALVEEAARSGAGSTRVTAGAGAAGVGAAAASPGAAAAGGAAGDGEAGSLGGGDGETGEQRAAAEAAFNASMARVLKDPESYLCEWVNATLAGSGIELSGRGASAIGELSTSHSDVLPRLIHALAPTATSERALASEDPAERAALVVAWATEHGVPSLTQPEDLKEANPRLILPFVMGLFTYYHTHRSSGAQAASSDGDTSLKAVFVVRQHFQGAAGALSSATLCAFRREEDAIKYALVENALLAGAAEGPALPALIARFAEAAAFPESAVQDSLGGLQSVLAAPEGEAAAAGGGGGDSAEAQRERVQRWVASSSADEVRLHGMTLAKVLAAPAAAGEPHRLFYVDAVDLY